MIDLEHAIGYYRVTEGSEGCVNRYRDEITGCAEAMQLRLDHRMFVDRGAAPPVLRPALRTLLDVLEFVTPSSTVVVPSRWHLSPVSTDLARLQASFQRRSCRLVVAEDLPTRLSQTTEF